MQSSAATKRPIVIFIFPVTKHFCTTLNTYWLRYSQYIFQSLGIWQSRIREDELYWNAMCKHRECKHTFVSGKVILPRMCDYFDKNPAFKADCIKYVQ